MHSKSTYISSQNETSSKVIKKAVEELSTKVFIFFFYQCTEKNKNSTNYLTDGELDFVHSI